tara:strand:+ start:3174 stop:3302 length:129 start_codon:yes stop_codon:yes gene_type:complete
MKKILDIFIHVIAFGGVIFAAYVLLVMGCVLTDECYYFYGGV